MQGNIFEAITETFGSLKPWEIITALALGIVVVTATVILPNRLRADTFVIMPASRQVTATVSKPVDALFQLRNRGNHEIHLTGI